MQGSARKDVVFGAARVYTFTVPGPKWKSSRPPAASRRRESASCPEVVRRRSPDFIGPRGRHGWALLDGPLGAMLFSSGNHVGDLLGVGWRSWDLCQPTFLPHVFGGPQWSLAAQPSSGPRRSA